tara:strand:+ start:217 stop:447 length:231 start_codon:yes stop_codon:yes gene_type:complete
MERRSRNKFMQNNPIPVTVCGRRRASGIGSGFKKISGPCKAAAKRKFKVWPSAYASGWGVRCTRAGGPGKMGKSKK